MPRSVSPSRPTGHGHGHGHGALGHVVQFYAATEELTAGVGAFLSDGLLTGGAVIVVATAAHRAAFAHALRSRGVDVNAARAAGTLIEQDAHDLLGQFTRTDGLDQLAFEKAVEDLVAAPLGQGRSVRIYGEMVAELWAHGQVDAALELEGFWNDLGERVAFSLYCAYPICASDDGASALALHQVCELHSALHGPRSPVEFALAEQPSPVVHFFDHAVESPGKARDLVRNVLGRWGDGGLIDDMALVITELATNAVRHTAHGFSVQLSQTPHSVRAAVGDASADEPARRTALPTAVSGRGLALVAALAGQWGYEATPTGKLVWAELPR
jgi:anti-sigma regulatory factor (Ser/Thr protein kinase)